MYSNSCKICLKNVVHLEFEISLYTQYMHVHNSRQQILQSAELVSSFHAHNYSTGIAEVGHFLLVFLWTLKDIYTNQRTRMQNDNYTFSLDN